MQIFVNKTALEVAPSTTVAELKAGFQAAEGFSGDAFFAGKPLADEQTLAECGIDSLNTVDLVVPVLGGKFHGSLAKAGKVRSQTPKVAKAEKKKKPRGRAFRRIQYNRRFVNVVAGFGGKKKGPNSNS